MQIEGVCDFCREHGDWASVFCQNKQQALLRQSDLAAVIPWNQDWISDSADFSPASLAQQNITIRFACPTCYRLPSLSVTAVLEEIHEGRAGKEVLQNLPASILADFLLEMLKQGVFNAHLCLPHRVGG